MSATTFIERQMIEMRQGGSPVVTRKVKRAIWISLKLPLYALAVTDVIVIRMIRPWFLVRFGSLISTRIGHFAGNTEMYFCERDAGINVPDQRHVDLFYLNKPICNDQLATMWRRVLRIWPAWILAPINTVNRFIPGGTGHEIGTNTQHDRDVHNLLDRFPPHLELTAEEEVKGEAGLRAMGVPPGSPFVCLLVRDSVYLDAHQPYAWSYHNYRDSDVQNYVLAAEELANRGYFVIRMGAKVRKAIKTAHPKVIDYAANGMRSDFMDIYLGAKCEFCISTGAGWDAIPEICRRPIVYVNFVPFGYLHTSRNEFISLPKHHVLEKEGRKLTLREIFTHGVGFAMYAADYESKGVQLIENTPEEIRDVVIEMAERLNSTWQSHEDAEEFQRRFWEIFPTDAVDAQGRPLHGEIRARFGAAFLRNNRNWLQ